LRGKTDGFVMGLTYQRLKLPALATILQVAFLSCTGILKMSVLH